jgi:hypothetical protein
VSVETSVLEAIEAELSPHGFVLRPEPRAIDDVEVVSVWARKTWNTNRAAVVLRATGEVRPGPRSQELKIRLGKAIGYFPFFYGIGLQLIWLGRDVLPLSGSLEPFVDSIDNQRSIVQSLFIVDLERRTTESARTWGQVVTGKFQDAIERGIRNGLSLA